MNKYQKFYIDNNLDMLDQQYKASNKALEEIYKEFSTNRQELIDKLSGVMMEFKITEEYMEMSAKERRRVNAEIQRTIFDLVNEEQEKSKDFIKDTLGDAAINTYKYKEYLLGLGIDFKSLPLAEKVITKIINEKIKGEIWSNRLWSNKKELETMLKKSCDDFIKGKISVNKIGQQIRANYDTDFYKSQRLARTELARVQGAINDKFDSDHEVEWQLWISTLDGKTSKLCREMDGKQFRIDDVNKPSVPLHVSCRSALVGIPSKDYKPTTRRNNETGEIIDYVNYNDWKTGVKPVKNEEPPKEKPKKGPTQKKKEEFKPAGSIKEANEYAINLGVKNASYKGIPLEVANEWNMGLLESFNKFDKLKDNFEYVGSAQERNKHYKKARFSEVMAQLKTMNPNHSEQQLEKYAIKHINKECGKLGQYTWAESTTRNHIKGVTLNANTVSKSNLNETLKNGMLNKWSPVGCDSVKSILDHEIGHQLDTMLSISKEKHIIDMYKKMSKEEITENLSTYSWKNSNREPVREFVAEAWAEYCNNPSPRPIAKEIGELIERRYNNG